MTAFIVGTKTVIDQNANVIVGLGTSLQRPVSPAVGTIWFNVQLDLLEGWDGVSWKPLIQNTNSGIWSFGRATTGVLANNSVINHRSSPALIFGGISDWIQVNNQCGGGVLALRSNGTLWGWGYNSNGQLGDNTTSNRSSPVQTVGGFTDWVHIASGNTHSLGIRSNGTAWSWGGNTNGQLGDGFAVAKSSPALVAGGFTDWVQLSGGGAGAGSFSLGIRSNGTAWSWGTNTYGQLGDNTSTVKSSPVSVVGGLIFNQVSCGWTHVSAITSNGTAWGWGNNSFGKIGDNTTTSTSSPVSVVGGFTDWVQINAGSNHTVGVRANGTAWSWGGNSAGDLGDGTTVSKSSPVAVVGGFTDWAEITTGWGNAIGLRKNGTLWGWGRNAWGELGTNTTTSTSSPVSVVGGFTDWVQVSTSNNITASFGIR